MVVQRSIGIRTLALFSRLVMVTLSFWGWFVIWENDRLGDTDLIHRCLLYNEFLLIGILFGSGKRREHHGSTSEFAAANRKTAHQTFLALSCVLVIAFVLQDLLGDTFTMRETRSFFLSYLPWLYLTLLFSNYLLPRSLSRWAFSGDREERIALVGTPEQADRFKPWLERKAALGMHAIGVISPRSSPSVEGAFPVLGTIEEVETVLKHHSITQVILLDLAQGNGLVRHLTHLCEKVAVRLLALYDMNDYFNHNTITFEDDGVRFIGLRQEPLESPVSRFLKRLIDLAIAIPVVVLVLPITTLVVWLIQRFQSAGPVFFWQVRTGMMGKSFRMMKYRTMHCGNPDEARQATRDDPRIYPAGHWLRRLNIDELPQFLNVLYGNMSVVGPRPHLSRHDEVWAGVEEKYPVRKFIKPGITGWAQVNGFRGEIHSIADIRRRIEADISYLENWSISLDVLVICKTVVQCFLPSKTAY